MSEPFTEGHDDRKVLKAGEDASGRLDSWLAAALEGQISRSRIKDLIIGGSVTLNGAAVVEPKRKIAPGDQVELIVPEPLDPLPQPENIPLDILYEDDDLVVVSKRAGMVVHPGAGNRSGTMVNALLHHCGASLSGIGGVRRPGIVHRLDKDTSGVMVVAKNDHAHHHLAAQFVDHGRTGPLQRAYLALVWGKPVPPKATIDAPVGRATSDRTKRAVKRAETSDSRHAITHYQLRAAYHWSGEVPASLLECRLETGRTHQIRVHLSHIGHPLIGDADYGAAFRTKANKLPPETAAIVSAFQCQALHAYLLQFEHPKTGQVMRFEAPPPEDMKALISAFDTLDRTPATP
ncbi:MAG: RluA family pseudouridine synthase [Alphaproteobacteria bacterium]|nr:RluA family pseudouridine synthase [Alphaproteobacteria bacterium]